MTSAEPIILTVQRFQCPFCHRARSRRKTAVAHIAECWRNPAAQSCLTCVHYERPCCPGGSDDCGCNGEATCNEGLNTHNEDGRTFVMMCPAWVPA